MLLPVLMLLLALLAQPVCMLYTGMVMNHAAAEAVRVLATTRNEATARDFALRRLEAVPEASLFHVGGRGDWHVTVKKDGPGGAASVGITGHVRPLPLLASAAAAFGRRDDEGVVMSVEVTERVRPRWLGGDYDDWMSAW